MPSLFREEEAFFGREGEQKIQIRKVRRWNYAQISPPHNNIYKCQKTFSTLTTQGNFFLLLRYYSTILGTLQLSCLTIVVALVSPHLLRRQIDHVIHLEIAAYDVVPPKHRYCCVLLPHQDQSNSCCHVFHVYGSRNNKNGAAERNIWSLI